MSTSSDAQGGGRDMGTRENRGDAWREGSSVGFVRKADFPHKINFVFLCRDLVIYDHDLVQDVEVSVKLRYGDGVVSGNVPILQTLEEF